MNILEMTDEKTYELGEKSALTPSTSHVYQINPACHEKRTDEQT